MKAINKEQTAKKIGKSTRWIEIRVQRSEFPQPVQIGGELRWIEDEIDAWLLAQPRGTFTTIRGAKK